MMTDLITWLDSTYRTVPDKKYRSLFGHSMGAYGAFRYGTLYKDKFCGLAACSAPANLEVIINTYQNIIKSENPGPPYTYNYSSGGYFTKMIFLGAGVWSPNLNSSQSYVSPQVVEYPFDQQGNIIDTIFDKWSANQVTTLVHNLSPADSMGILFGSGTNDELYFNICNLALRDTLNALNLDYQFYNYIGGHAMPAGFKTLALDFLDSYMLPPTTLPEQCTEPSDLLAYNITINSAELSWTENGNANNWEIALDVSGFDLNSSTPVVVSNNPANWAGLSPNTNYDWYVRADCGDDNYSNWIGPFTFTTENNLITQTIELTNGWNIHSFDVTPDNPDMLSVHANLISEEHLVKIFNESGGFVQYVSGYGWMNTIGDMQLTEGYYIKVDTTLSFEVTGYSNINDTIPLSMGWNIMGYPLDIAQNAMSAVQPLIDQGVLTKVINDNGGFIQYITGIGWMNTIGNFEPGEGYYIKLSADADLILNYPQGSNKSTSPNNIPEPVLFEKSYANNPFNPMNIIVQDIDIRSLSIMEGDEIAVYDGDVCVGAGVITLDDGNYSAIIVASMDDPTTEAKDGYTEGKQIIFKYRNKELQNPIELEAESILGVDQFKPLGTYVVSLSNQWLKTDEENEFVKVDVNTYPNPVKDQMTVEYNIPQGFVYVGIIDGNGTRQTNLISEFQDEGNHILKLDASSFNQGFYILQIRVVSKDKIYNQFHKFIKL